MKRYFLSLVFFLSTVIIMTACQNDNEIKESKELILLNQSNKYVTTSDGKMNFINSISPVKSQKKTFTMSKKDKLPYIHLDKNDKSMYLKVISENGTNKEKKIVHQLFSRDKKVKFELNNKIESVLELTVKPETRIEALIKINTEDIEDEISYFAVEKGNEHQADGSNLHLTRLFVSKNEKLNKNMTSSFKENLSEKDLMLENFTPDLFIHKNKVIIQGHNTRYPLNIYLFNKNKNLFTCENLVIKPKKKTTIPIKQLISNPSEEKYLIYTKGKGKDIILDFNDIKLKKKELPDSFQNIIYIKK